MGQSRSLQRSGWRASEVKEVNDGIGERRNGSNYP